jgi:hypothetical protein
VTSILYVRARLRLERGDQTQIVLPFVAHGIGLLMMCALALLGMLPWSAALAVMLLTLRALAGLSRHRLPTQARIVGLEELGYGLLTVLLVALGYRF